jgi:hypothetical protein
VEIIFGEVYAGPSLPCLDSLTPLINAVGLTPGSWLIKAVSCLIHKVLIHVIIMKHFVLHNNRNGFKFKT